MRLAELLSCGGVNIAEQLLASPATEPFTSPEELDALWRLARNAGLSRLFLLHVLSSVAHYPLPPLVYAWLIKKNAPIGSLLGFPLEKALTARWTAFPVLTITEQREARETWFLACLGAELNGNDLLPSWAADRFDNDAQESLRHAAAAAGLPEGHGVVVTPLLTENAALICGTSLGLPAALAFSLLAKAESWPAGLYATGGTDPGGIVQAVSHVREKLNYARKTGMSLFLYPSASLECPGPNTEEDCLALHNLKEALVFVEWRFKIGIKQSGSFTFFLACLGDSRRLLANLPDDIGIPETLLLWAERHNKLRDLLCPATESEEGLEALLGCFRNRKLSRGRATILSRLFKVDEVEQLALAYPELAFLWASQTLGVVNHSGAVVEAQDWDRLAYSLRERVESSVPKDWASHVNRGFVRERHNCYDFRPELPEEFERQFNRRQEIYSKTAEPEYQLGSYYGTIAQNYGFCGPAYLAQAEYAVRQGERVFGQHPDLKRETSRLYSYLGYARLDAGDMQGAADCIRRCLGIFEEDELPGVLPRFAGKPFALAMLLRFLADTGSAPSWHDLLAAVESGLNDGEASHPVQLILYNAGRLALAAGKHEEARRWWNKSVELCHGMEETVRPMALLPLAALHQTGLAVAVDKVKEVIQAIRQSVYLKQEHFRELLEAESPVEVLALVAARPGRFFPFTYR